MKKSSSTESAAPATKPKAAPKAKAAAAPAEPKPVKPRAPRATKPKAAKSAPPTVIEAAVNVGFGNALFARGGGGGLSWEVGTPLVCEGPDKWSLALSAAEPIAFKLLLNDEVWSVGDDALAAPGATTCVAPSFA
jgi:hypothetical protein